jgi:hypothetical protein
MLKPGKEYRLAGNCDVGMGTHYLSLDPPLKAMYIRREEIYGEKWDIFAVKMNIGGSEELTRIKVPGDKFQEDAETVKSVSFRLKRIVDNPWWYNSKQVKSFLVTTLELAEREGHKELADLTRRKIEIRTPA